MPRAPVGGLALGAAVPKHLAARAALGREERLGVGAAQARGVRAAQVAAPQVLRDRARGREPRRRRLVTLERFAEAPRPRQTSKPPLRRRPPARARRRARRGAPSPARGPQPSTFSKHGCARLTAPGGAATYQQPSRMWLSERKQKPPGRRMLPKPAAHHKPASAGSTVAARASPAAPRQRAAAWSARSRGARRHEEPRARALRAKGAQLPHARGNLGKLHAHVVVGGARGPGAAAAPQEPRAAPAARRRRAARPARRPRPRVFGRARRCARELHEGGKDEREVRRRAAAGRRGRFQQLARDSGAREDRSDARARGRSRAVAVAVAVAVAGARLSGEAHEEERAGVRVDRANARAHDVSKLQRAGEACRGRLVAVAGQPRDHGVDAALELAALQPGAARGLALPGVGAGRARARIDARPRAEDREERTTELGSQPAGAASVSAESSIGPTQPSATGAPASGAPARPAGASGRGSSRIAAKATPSAAATAPTPCRVAVHPAAARSPRSRASSARARPGPPARRSTRRRARRRWNSGKTQRAPAALLARPATNARRRRSKLWPRRGPDPRVRQGRRPRRLPGRRAACTARRRRARARATPLAGAARPRKLHAASGPRRAQSSGTRHALPSATTAKSSALRGGRRSRTRHASASSVSRRRGGAAPGAAALAS